MREYYRQRVNVDRYGNPYVLTRLKEKVSKGEIIEGVYTGFVEIDGKLIKIEVSGNNKDYRDGKNSKWLKVTKLQKKTNQSRF